MVGEADVALFLKCWTIPSDRTTCLFSEILGTNLMLTWQHIYFQEAQEKLQNKLPLLKRSLTLVLVRTAAPNFPTFPSVVTHEQLLDTPQSHQRLWKHKQPHVWTGTSPPDPDTCWRCDPWGIRLQPLSANRPGSGNNPNASLWIWVHRINSVQEYIRGESPAACCRAGRGETGPPGWVLCGSSCWLDCEETGTFDRLDTESLWYVKP